MDKHVRRDGGDYATALAKLLPTGQAWSREPDSILMRLVSGLAEVWAYVDGRLADLLERESDPRATLEMLEDWERNWGLPDPCFAKAGTIAERRTVLLEWMTLRGGQSREFFITMAARLGYTIRITERAPFMAGISEAGDTTDEFGDPRWEVGPEEIRFNWIVHVGGARLTWFRAGVGQAGVDHHLEIGIFDDLECMLRRWKPAHTIITFDYSGLTNGSEFEGTP